MMNILRLLGLSLLFPFAARATEVKLLESGLEINAGDAGTFLMSYPWPLSPMDKAVAKLESTEIAEDGNRVTLKFTEGCTMTIERGEDGLWNYSLTGIPEEGVKIAFSLPIPLEAKDNGATWAFDDGKTGPFPQESGTGSGKQGITLYQGNPCSFSLAKGGEGFTITFPITTWNMLRDPRPWGKKNFALDLIRYFPGKKHLAETTYSLRITDLEKPAK